MNQSVKQKACDILQTLVSQPLCYVLKSPDTDLYDFGFGKVVETTNWKHTNKRMHTHIIHATCRFEIIWRNEERRVDRYYEDTPSEIVYSDTEKLIGHRIKCFALSEKNDLWLDLGEYWIVFATFETGEESWRFLTHDHQVPHVVASNQWLRLDF